MSKRTPLDITWPGRLPVGLSPCARSLLPTNLNVATTYLSQSYIDIIKIIGVSGELQKKFDVCKLDDSSMFFDSLKSWSMQK